MDARPNITLPAFLIADAARAAMLVALLDCRARPAGELARLAGVTAQTASSHLAKLLAGDLVVVEIHGRHRYYRLAGSHVAVALESLAVVAPERPARHEAKSREARGLGFARSCYDHLAGRLGVAVACGLQRRGFLASTGGERYDVTPSGAEWFAAFGVDMTIVGPDRRGLARPCLDWTERRNHLAGPLGAKLMGLVDAKGWIRRTPSSRAVEVTPEGWRGFGREFGIEEWDLRSKAPASATGP